MASPTLRVIVADDQGSVRESVCEVLRASGHRVCGAVGSGEEAIQEASLGGADIVLMDIGMPGMGGVEAARRIGRLANPVPVVFLTGLGEQDVAEASEGSGFGYLAKPFRPDQLDPVVQAAVQRFAEQQQRLCSSIPWQLRAVPRRAAGRAPAGGTRGHSWAHLAAATDGAAHLAVVASKEGRVLAVNAAGRCLLGLEAAEEVADLMLADLYAPAERERLVRDYLPAVARVGLWMGETALMDAAGKEVAAAVVLAAHQGGTGGHDHITMSAYHTPALAHAGADPGELHRLEVFGRLAGGMAHDFCNSLMPIMAYAGLLRDRLGAEDPLRGYADLIAESAAQAAALPQWLMAVGRRQEGGRTAVDLNHLVTGMAKVLRRAIGEDIEVTTATDAVPARVATDPGQVEQALVALAIEARKAMPAGGTFAISTANVTPEDAAAGFSAEMPDGDWVLLAVTATRAAEDRRGGKRLCWPSTAMGGTCRAPALIEGFARRAGGCVRVSPVPGEGITFRILLPPAPHRGPDDGGGGGGAQGGGETILVVDDDEDVRWCVEVTLRELGYTVLHAGSGPDALKLEQEYPGPIHLMLTDVIMPGMNGRELAERLAPLRPDTKVLYMSGYPADAITRQGVLIPGIVLLRKPFTPAVLAEEIRQVLERPTG